MALSLVASGDQLCVISTDHDVATDTTPGVYVLEVDHSPVIAGDTLVISILGAVRSTGTGATQRTLAYNSEAGVPTDPIDKSIGPVVCGYGCTARLRQTAGTGRTIPWSLWRVG